MATYPVECACGATLQVPASAAGSRLDCRCGRAVEVPSLSRLKAAVGQSTVSADFELEQLSLAGALPLESECVLCHCPTNFEARYNVTCEVATEDSGEMPVWQRVLLGLLFGGVIGAIAASAVRLGMRPPTVRGRDLILRLPVRVCNDCVHDLKTPSDVRDAMGRTPVYGRLFEKYPRAVIRNAD